MKEAVERVPSIDGVYIDSGNGPWWIRVRVAGKNIVVPVYVEKGKIKVNDFWVPRR